MAQYTALSLDLGSNTGYCLIEDGLITQSGVMTLSSKDSHPGTRFARFQRFLSEYKHVNEIMYEFVPGFKSADAARVHCGLLAITQLFCLASGKRMTTVKAKTVKKEFSGNGNADKAAMCKTAHRLGWKHGHPETDIDHDEADAIACAFVVYARRNITLRFKD